MALFHKLIARRQIVVPTHITRSFQTSSPIFSKMPKLYYSPTSCGAASFIAAHAAGVQLDVEQVDLRSHTTSSGTDFYKINVKGNVPALVLEDGTVLNEGAAVLQFIADQVRISTP